MPDQLIEFRTSMLARLIMLLTILVALFASWFVVRWYVGNTLAEYFNREDTGPDTAQMAVFLAPNDPLAHWRLGNIIHKKLPPDRISTVVAEYEKAVSLSPNDYRFWMELGQALEQAGEHEKSEKALREAVRLAPSYSYPRWYLGNLLIRTDRYPEAFAELQVASDAHPELRPQLFNLAWQINKDDFESLKAAVGSNPGTRAEFANYLLARGKVDEGLRFWNSLNESEKRSNRVTADAIITSLIKAGDFHKAIEIWNSVAPGPAYHAGIGKILDPGFEDNLAHGPSSPFGWQVPSLSQVQIGITAALGHSGSRSLRIFLQVRSNLEAVNVAQLVPVAPDTQYELECYVKTDKLVSASTPFVAIADATNSGQLAAAEPAPNGSSDWQRISLSFKTAPKTEAVLLSVSRNSCGAENPICPIFGTVWYDDFNLKARK
ncbi:MAG: tetratricopeptide repeat protein [Acidobacteriota bacterium]|nr:tetratricopeptide repeat protein [Acidobacteriota bacterium]